MRKSSRPERPSQHAREEQQNRRTNPLSFPFANPVDVDRLQELRCATQRIAAALRQDARYAVLARVHADQWSFWEFGQCPASAATLMQSIGVGLRFGSVIPVLHGITIPASGLPTGSLSSKSATDIRIDSILPDVARLPTCSLFVAWQAGDNTKCHFRHVNETFENAFRQVAEAVVEEIQCVLDLA